MWRLALLGHHVAMVWLLIIVSTHGHGTHRRRRIPDQGTFAWTALHARHSGVA